MPAMPSLPVSMFAAVFSLLSLPAMAGPLVDAATKAEQMATSGNPVGAHDAMAHAQGSSERWVVAQAGRYAATRIAPRATPIGTPALMTRKIAPSVKRPKPRWTRLNRCSIG